MGGGGECGGAAAPESPEERTENVLFSFGIVSSGLVTEFGKKKKKKNLID